MLALRGANAGAVLKKINPIVRGWSAYYRTVVSSEIFTALDNYMWKLAYKWAKHSHPNKPKHWISSKYFGRFNKARKDRWVFGDRDSGAYLLKFSWTKIVRHQLVKGRASPDDPALASYWVQRRRKGPPPPVDGMTVHLLQAQQGRCRSAEGSCCTPITRREARKNGKRGGPSSERRSPSSTSRFQAVAHRAINESVSSTPFVNGGMEPPS